ncbi:hypothetical protein QTP88_000070 [Uroleucon formosanum]
MKHRTQLPCFFFLHYVQNTSANFSLKKRTSSSKYHTQNKPHIASIKRIRTPSQSVCDITDITNNKYTMNNKKTVPPLIIPKARIQSVPNKTPKTPTTPDSDGFSSPTNYKRLFSPSQSSSNNHQKKQATYVSKNRYSPLSSNVTHETADQAHINSSMDLDLDNDPNIIETKPPPPIFIHTVNDFASFCTQIKEITKNDEFSCKSSINGVKLTTSTVDSYRTIIRFLQSNNAHYHTYQLKEEKPFRVVIRNLHYTTPLVDIKNELISLGHNPRNITNVLQRNTKLPLPLFFIDLEPNINNKDIFKIDLLCHSKIKIEEPRINHQPIQCLRCQNYGHTKSYCNHPPKCVRCGEPHLSNICQKSKDLPAKCALCNGPHPANYRGCPVHKSVQANQLARTKNHPAQDNSNLTRNNYMSGNNNILNNVNTTSNSNSFPSMSYSQATKKNKATANHPNASSEVNADQFSIKLSSFIDDLKSLITPLISLLTTVIDKLITSNNAK